MLAKMECNTLGREGGGVILASRWQRERVINILKGTVRWHTAVTVSPSVDE